MHATGHPPKTNNGPSWISFNWDSHRRISRQKDWMPLICLIDAGPRERHSQWTLELSALHLLRGKRGSFLAKNYTINHSFENYSTYTFQGCYPHRIVMRTIIPTGFRHALGPSYTSNATNTVLQSRQNLPRYQWGLQLPGWAGQSCTPRRSSKQLMGKHTRNMEILIPRFSR